MNKIDLVLALMFLAFAGISLWLHEPKTAALYFALTIAHFRLWAAPR